MADATQGGAPKKKLSTQEILAAARAQAGQVAPAAAASAVGETASVPASETASVQAPSVEKTGAEEAPAAQKKAPPAAGTGPKSTSEILARARAEAAQKGAGAGSAAAASAAPAAAKKPAVAKPAAGGAKKSTADILAAARAAGGAKAAVATAPGAAAAKPAASKTPAATAKATIVADDSGPKLSVQEMLAAVRPGALPAAPKADAPAGAPPGAPPMPQKPVPSRKPAAASSAQAGSVAGGIAAAVAILLSPFFLAWTLLAATTAIASLATARFMLPNVLAEPPSKFKIGPPTDFDLGTVATKLVAQYGVWIVHTDQYQGKNLIYALISVCTHLGCTPSWLEGEQKFKCPCHGSGFYITGINFEGPAPRPLERAAIRLAPDGMLEVDKSVKFQEEMGQWADPTSYYEVVA